MAFCNSCGANLEGGAKFCSKCGAVVSDGPIATSYPQAPPAQRQSSGALKILLIAFGIILVMGVLSIVGVLFVARNTRVEQSGGKVKLQSPFGTVETTKDPAEAAKNLGIELYPGARALQAGSASVNIGNSHTVAANFESDDPPDKVAEFYKSQLPNAKVSVSNGNTYSIVSTENKGFVTISIQPEGDKTAIHIASVKGNAVVVDGNSKD
jgi:hypothetical protein